MPKGYEQQPAAPSPSRAAIKRGNTKAVAAIVGAQLASVKGVEELVGANVASSARPVNTTLIKNVFLNKIGALGNLMKSDAQIKAFNEFVDALGSVIGKANEISSSNFQKRHQGKDLKGLATIELLPLAKHLLAKTSAINNAFLFGVKGLSDAIRNVTEHLYSTSVAPGGVIDFQCQWLKNFGMTITEVELSKLKKSTRPGFLVRLRGLVAGVFKRKGTAATKSKSVPPPPPPFPAGGGFTATATTTSAGGTTVTAYMPEDSKAVQKASGNTAGNGQATMIAELRNAQAKRAEAGAGSDDAEPSPRKRRAVVPGSPADVVPCTPGSTAPYGQPASAIAATSGSGQSKEEHIYFHTWTPPAQNTRARRKLELPSPKKQ